MKRKLYYVMNSESRKILGVFKTKTEAQKAIKAHYATTFFILNNKKDFNELVEKQNPSKLSEFNLYLTDFKKISYDRLFYGTPKKVKTYFKEYGFDNVIHVGKNNYEMPFYFPAMKILSEEFDCDSFEELDKIQDVLLDYFNLVSLEEYETLEEDKKDIIRPIIGPVFNVYENKFSKEIFCF